jgi:hypothetical protein
MFLPRSMIVFGMLSLALLSQTGCSKPKIPTGEVTGKITINGKPVPGLFISFVPQEKIRPAMGKTDAAGNYRAQFVAKQSGVPLGPCVAQFSLYHGEGTRNYLPAKFNEQASKIPELNLNITEVGLVFDYDIKYDGELPPGI